MWRWIRLLVFVLRHRGRRGAWIALQEERALLRLRAVGSAAMPAELRGRPWVHDTWAAEMKRRVFSANSIVDLLTDTACPAETIEPRPDVYDASAPTA